MNEYEPWELNFGFAVPKVDKAFLNAKKNVRFGLRGWNQLAFTTLFLNNLACFQISYDHVCKNRS